MATRVARRWACCNLALLFIKFLSTVAMLSRDCVALIAGSASGTGFLIPLAKSTSMGRSL